MNAHRILFPALALALSTGLLAVGCSDDNGTDLPMEPQILPRINPVNICEVEVGRQATVDVLLDNWGQEQLKIRSYEVHHDRRCAFSDMPDHLGDVRLHDNDEDDEWAATVRSREAAFMRVQYTPPAAGEDEITITIHSNAGNAPDLDVYVCGAGVTEPPLRCETVRQDPACSASNSPCENDLDCSLVCSGSGGSCTSQDDCDPGEFCYSAEICRPDGSGGRSCQCRPCAIPPDDDWADCAG